ncbi:MAG: tRNA guanosine(34) transglycosylase Tgt [Kosmotoga sp.]|nr:MAG: tRNA guanosine(34) transglycosylase Tgt [Kosmotoga sp.]
MLEFEVLSRDKKSLARRGRIITRKGNIETPVFMPVGTNGTVKGLWQHQLLEIDTQIILGNAFHLYLKPGLDVLKHFKGLHNFMNWSKPILTDSGGFQIFSIGEKKVTDDGVTIKSPLDGSWKEITPEFSMKIQQIIDSDIVMVLDECLPPGINRDYVEESVNRTTSWAIRCLKVHDKERAIFGIVQGGFYEELREKSAREITSLNFDGFAIGGLSVGEDFECTSRIMSFTVKILPDNKPRYVMGIGSPDLIINAVDNGIDMFDCVLPTRIGRHGTALTWDGKVNLKAARYKYDDNPVDPQCDCRVCRTYSRAYLHHLFRREELLGKLALSYHNTAFLNEFTRRIRNAIESNQYNEFKNDCIKRELIGSGVIKN